MWRSSFVFVALTMVMGACGGGADDASAAVTTTAALPTSTRALTTTVPATTTTTSSVASTTSSPTTTSTTTIPPTTTEPSEPETLALGTLQVAFLASEVDGSVALPEPPFGVSMTVEGEDGTVEYEFVDPDPGYVTRTSDLGDTLLSVTIRTFAVPLEPGDYTITQIKVDAEILGPDPVAVPPVPSPEENALMQPRFTVVADAPCTFIGELTSTTVRFPPLGPLEVVDYARVFAANAAGILTTDPDGALFSGDFGLSLLSEHIEGDLAGHSWWMGGEQIDEAQCVTLEAQF